MPQSNGRLRGRISSPCPEVVTVHEAAELLRCSESTVVRGIRSGKLPSFTHGRRLLLPRAVLLARAFRQGPAER